MYCRYCGKQIRDDSSFCPYCGKSLDRIKNDNKQEETPIQTNESVNRNKDNYYEELASKTASSAYKTITKVFCYCALGILLILNFKMNPWSEVPTFITYLVTAAIAIGLVVLFNKKTVPSDSKKKHTFALLISVLVIIVTVGLRIVYEIKVDSVVSNFPSNGIIRVSIHEDTVYYSDTGGGRIKNPKTLIFIDDKSYTGGNFLTVDINKRYNLSISVGGTKERAYNDYSYSAANNSFSGFYNGSITFSPNSFKAGQYNISRDVKFYSGPASSATVKLSFTRECSFWEVIFH